VGEMLALDAVLSTAGEAISAHCCVGALIDNMALISRIQTWHHQGAGGTLHPEYDLLHVAKGIMAKHKLVVEPEHIKSHQDNDTEYSNLPWKAQLNCDCNQLVGSTRTCPQCLEASPTLYIPPTGHTASLEIDGTFITSHIASAIKETSFRLDFIKYVIHKAGWQVPMIFHSIDLEARAHASLHSSPSQHLTIFKLEFALFATMSCQHRMEKSIDHRCPRCQKFQETRSHVFQCPNGPSIHTTAWAKATLIFKKTPTCPFIIATLGHSISQLSTGGPVHWQGPTPALDDSKGQVVITAFKEQQSIGWEQAIRGRISKQWGRANTLYCQERLHQGDTLHAVWNSNLVSGMWQYGIDQWVGRNEFLYGKTKEERLAKTTQEVDSQIRHMHRADRKQVSSIDKHLIT
jgi:hypothetical protein